MSHTADRLLDQLRDERGRRVVLVSHCLLNENTRYAGGATRPGAVAEVVEPLLAEGYGIHQLPCPERVAWGGVLKRYSFVLYGSRGTARYRARRPLLSAFLIWTRLVYRRLARQVAREVVDYRRSGIEVAGFVGIGASPSCGVTTTVDMLRSMEVVAACPLASLTRDVMNTEAVLGCRRAGPGMFVSALDRELRRRGAAVPAVEHDLAGELQGGSKPAVASNPTLAPNGSAPRHTLGG